jgi:lysosomal Pro-X carboxypeptidase
MLAAWLQLKYLHITTCAHTSSSPILYFEEQTPQDAYDRVVTKDFRDASENCYRSIKESWEDMADFASFSGLGWVM